MTDVFTRYYNKTKYSGLETHIANSYANPLLQLYKFTPMLRNLALHHTASSCLFETCLLCEMGFLFDMLEKASGQNCQATNLLKTFSGLSHGKLYLSVHSAIVVVTITNKLFHYHYSRLPRTSGRTSSKYAAYSHDSVCE